jgi:glycosyltransferase involved in cell wall biosynthesis/spore maturation protein CgeB
MGILFLSPVSGEENMGPQASQPRPEQNVDLPRELQQFRDFHCGETIVVCGCGNSLSQFVAPERVITIGVNDVGRLFDPDYLVVLNPPGQFASDRFRYVAESRAKAVFTQLELGISHPHIVRFRLGRRGDADLSDPDVLPYTRNSPYLALCLAVHMGAKRIGLVGVDFTDNHFFALTGRHVLTGELARIDQEYRNLYEKCSRRCIEIFNLSSESRLTALPKMSQEDFLRSVTPNKGLGGRKVFLVNYRFLSCGTVFRDGLANAAGELGIDWRAECWDDPQLPEKIQAFNPDVLFVVHGRKFSARWKTQFANYPSAVWLLDEPYEVDDTGQFSRAFGTVFVNDPNTLGRHHNAHYLPVCYDPKVHTYLPGDERQHAVGFVGGCNPRREQALGRLARRELLSYVVGGPWSDPAVRGVSISPNIPPGETVRLYRGTRIAVNLFRSQHHYNRDGIQAFSLNPRVYEALGCGALVISEHRPEIDTLCPEMPFFRNPEEMEFQIERHLRDPDLYARVRKDCIRRLAGHTYADRLATVIRTVSGEAVKAVCKQDLLPDRVAAPPVLADWEADADCAGVDSNGGVVLQKALDRAAGSERGLVGKVSHRNLVLEFEVQLESDTVFVAKIHQAEARNQLSNSYHLMCRGTRAYLARHSQIFANFSLPAGAWTQLAISYYDGVVVLRHRGAEVARASDRILEAGYCFLGVKGGIARLRNINIRIAYATALRDSSSSYRTLVPGRDGVPPKVSIITTVYDRVDCLERCIRSVRALEFRDYEHIVVADSPPVEIRERIEELVARHSGGSGNPALSVLHTRQHDWGISPAAAGLDMARGKYISFLSDDNGYLPRHFNSLVAALDGDAGLGFAYSSCLYDGRLTLTSSVPRPGRIDLGQPLFRRELFDRYLGGKLPFKEFGWDWRMIERFTQNGVRWRHINDATFVFRLAKYPDLIAGAESGMISYCIACYRPAYARQLIDDLIRKTSAKYEILLWMNVVDADFDQFVNSRVAGGAPARVVGCSPENIGMAAYPRLFEASRGEMVAQVDDDVICVSPRIAETAKVIFDRFPEVGMLTADVWQDEYTTGARPPMEHYRLFNQEFGLYDGPIDGWFAVYRKSSLTVCRNIRAGRYFSLGCAIKSQLGTLGQQSLLCTRMKVFHVVDPTYVAHFGMLDAEVAKYREIGRQDQVNFYTAARGNVPPMAELAERVERIRESFTRESWAERP